MQKTLSVDEYSSIYLGIKIVNESKFFKNSPFSQRPITASTYSGSEIYYEILNIKNINFFYSRQLHLILES